MSFVTQFVGVVAAVCTTIAAGPQLLYILKTKSTANISLATQLLNFTGAFLWFLYGLFIRDPILYIECCIVTFIYFCILVAMVRDRCFIKVPEPLKQPNDLPYSVSPSVV